MFEPNNMKTPSEILSAMRTTELVDLFLEGEEFTRTGVLPMDAKLRTITASSALTHVTAGMGMTFMLNEVNRLLAKNFVDAGVY